jgi:diguanylate cyclase (GGDEF)-like protein
MTRRPAPSVDRSRLLNRILELEYESHAAQERTRVLAALTAAFARITTAREHEEIVARLLQTACDPLGFARAVYFEREEHMLLARWQLEARETVERASGIGFTSQTPHLRRLATERLELVGHAGDLSAPLVDVRGWFVFAELANDDTSFGYLYADGHSRSEPHAWELPLVEALAAIGTAALQSGAHFSRVADLATRDPLTGLLNRRAFDDLVAREVESSRRRSSSFGIAIVDLDDLKRINDSGGHELGDTVLRRLASTLGEAVRGADAVGRLAGDEFAIFLADADAGVARNAIRRVSASLRANGLRCSIGVALYPRSGPAAEHVMRAADKALYAVKAAGKNGFAFA